MSSIKKSKNSNKPESRVAELFLNKKLIIVVLKGCWILPKCMNYKGAQMSTTIHEIKILSIRLVHVIIDIFRKGLDS